MTGDKLTLSFTTLLTGFLVVFCVLLVLIGIIKLYGTVIYRIQTGIRSKSLNNKELPAAPAPAIERQAPPVFELPEQDDDEIIAVIAAAVYAAYEPGSVRIRSIRRSSPRGSAWRSAGLSDNLRQF